MYMRPAAGVCTPFAGEVFQGMVKNAGGKVENSVERVESLFVSSPDGTKELLFWRLGGFIVAQRYPTGLAVLNKIQYNEVFKQE
jgi:hypothetical protein